MYASLKKFIYELKQASRQWYKKFDLVISYFGFSKNIVDECVYVKTRGVHGSVNRTVRLMRQPNRPVGFAIAANRTEP